ncbi:MAG: hypothetical protein ABIT09_07325 [Croceibacterium sp.]
MHTNWLLGIAAFALATSPALAQGKGHGGDGGGNDGGNGPADRGPGMQAAAAGNENGSSKGKGGSVEAYGNIVKATRPDGRDGPDGDASKSNRPSQAIPQSEKRAPGQARQFDDSAQRAVRTEPTPRAMANNGVPTDDGGPARKTGRDTWHTRSADDDARLQQVFAAPSQGLVDGCPPGLAAKNNGCRPPGLDRNQDAAWRESLYRPDWWGYSNLARDGRYVYDNGYLYRLTNTGGVASFIPLLGGALGIGNGWPSTYQSVALPDYYQRYYGLGPVDTYRYADNVIYRVDPSSSAITSIAGLLTGDNFNVGQRLPAGYDAYNVPYPYRDQYADSPTDMYRYSDGYVYDVDPKTQLITAAIELLGTVL